MEEGRRARDPRGAPAERSPLPERRPALRRRALHVRRLRPVQQHALPVFKIPQDHR